MTLIEKKRLLEGYTGEMARAQRMRGDLGRFKASADSIQKEIDACIHRAEKSERIISSIKDHTHREILLRKYIYGDTLEEIAEVLCYSVRHLQRIIETALSALCIEEN